jgi:23S rRNA (guanosine2251-2'-O)-methyltransferase
MKKPHKAEKIYMYGRHALMEALLSAPQVVRKVFLSPENRDKELRDLIAKLQIPTARLEGGQGSEIVGKDAAHQGVIAFINPATLLQNFDTFLSALPSPASAKMSIVILGEVQDPHNVGAIIRSAAAFGVSAVLIPEHNQAQITGAVVKASAGMVFRVPLVSIGNVNQAISALKKRGFWIYGLAADGKQTLAKEKFAAPAVFVVGNEGAGIREKTLHACDVTLSIPIHARTESLNAAVSAALVFYEWSRNHPEAIAAAQK